MLECIIQYNNKITMQSDDNKVSIMWCVKNSQINDLQYHKKNSKTMNIMFLVVATTKMQNIVKRNGAKSIRVNMYAYTKT